MQQAARRRGQPALGATTGTGGSGGSGEPAGPSGDDAHLDLLAVVGRHHSTTWSLLSALRIPPPPHGDPARRRRQQADALVRHLARHEAAEQQVLWPAVADGVPGGVDLAGEGTRQERDIRRALASLPAAAGTVELEDLVDLLHEELRRHLAHEDLVLRHVASSVEPELRRELGAVFVQRYRRGPTRPHPHLPSGPAVQRLVGAPLAVLDRWRDAVGRDDPSGQPR